MSPAESLRTENGAVIAPDGRRLGYGELVAGDMLHVQAQPTSKLKDPATFKVMGQADPARRYPGQGHGRRGLCAGHAAARHGACARGAAAELWRAADRLRHGSGRENAGRREGGARRQFPRRRRRRRNSRPSRRCGRWRRPRNGRRRAQLPKQDDLPTVLTALPSQDTTIFQRSDPSVERQQDHRGDLHAALSVARLDRPVLRGRAIRRRRDDGVDAHARRLSRSRRRIAEMLRMPPASVRLHPCRRLRLLRPQRRRRCRGRCGADRARSAGRAGARAMDARAGARLGAVSGRRW